MIQALNCPLLITLLLFLGTRPVPALAAAEAPDFKEIQDLIRAHAAGLTETELNRAAVEGLLERLGPKVELVNRGSEANAADKAAPLATSRLFEGDIAYFRVARVGGSLVRDIRSAQQRFTSTNTVKGVVLDLRYADGADYAVAAEAADLFLSQARPLLNWGEGPVSSQVKTNAIRVPAAILVNAETARAAEALAAALRQTGNGLILGSRTAGQAMVTKDFPLKGGGLLRIATTPVMLGDGSELPVGGIKPDIEVTVSPEDERLYYADAFAVVPRGNLLASADLSDSTPAGATNAGPRRGRLNEAELVREHRESLDRDADARTAARPVEAEKPLVSDPALARALDLLKGLAVVRAERF